MTEEILEYLDDKIQELTEQMNVHRPLCKESKYNTIMPLLNSTMKAYKEIYNYVNSPRYMKQQFEQSVNERAKKFYRC